MILSIISKKSNIEINIPAGNFGKQIALLQNTLLVENDINNNQVTFLVKKNNNIIKINRAVKYTILCNKNTLTKNICICTATKQPLEFYKNKSGSYFLGNLLVDYDETIQNITVSDFMIPDLLITILQNFHITYFLTDNILDTLIILAPCKTPEGLKFFKFYFNCNGNKINIEIIDKKYIIDNVTHNKYLSTKNMDFSLFQDINMDSTLIMNIDINNKINIFTIKNYEVAQEYVGSLPYGKKYNNITNHTVSDIVKEHHRQYYNLIFNRFVLHNEMTEFAINYLTAILHFKPEVSKFIHKYKQYLTKNKLQQQQNQIYHATKEFFDKRSKQYKQLKWDHIKTNEDLLNKIKFFFEQVDETKTIHLGLQADLNRYRLESESSAVLYDENTLSAYLEGKFTMELQHKHVPFAICLNNNKDLLYYFHIKAGSFLLHNNNKVTLPIDCALESMANDKSKLFILKNSQPELINIKIYFGNHNTSQLYCHIDNIECMYFALNKSIVTNTDLFKHIEYKPLCVIGQDINMNNREKVYLNSLVYICKVEEQLKLLVISHQNREKIDTIGPVETARIIDIHNLPDILNKQYTDLNFFIQKSLAAIKINDNLYRFYFFIKKSKSDIVPTLTLVDVVKNNSNLYSIKKCVFSDTLDQFRHQVQQEQFKKQKN